MTGKVSILLRVTEFPEECECGSAKATVLVTNIERVSDRSLVMVVKCSGCERKYLVSDPVAEGLREAREDGYHPTYFLTEDGRVVLWFSPEGRTLRLEAIIGGPIG